MKRFALKRTTMFVVSALLLVTLGCHKNVAAPPVAAPPPPPPPPPAPTVTLTADRTAINAGQSVTLSYAATNATSVTIQPGIGAVQPATSGTRQVSPAALTRYSATATGPGGTATSAEVTVSVAAAAPPPPPPTPPPAPRPAPPPAPRAPTLDEIFSRTLESILFDYDKATIRAGEESKLLNGAAWLKQNPTVRFTIEGHADERGSQEYNIALGDERAAAVKKYLADQGVADTRMNTVSYGEERPTCRQETEDCWQQNRRAAFTRIP